MNLSDLEETIKNTDTLIKGNYENLKKYKDMLNQSSVNVTINIENSSGDIPDVYDTIELDVEWWKNNIDNLEDWVAYEDEHGQAYYCHINPDTQEIDITFNPTTTPPGGWVHIKQGTTTTHFRCRLFLNGSLDNVNEIIVPLKCADNGGFRNQDTSPENTSLNIGNESSKNQLVIVPDVDADTQQGPAAADALGACQFGDALVNGANNNSNNVTHTLAGFSQGGITALNIVSGRTGNCTGTFEKLVLINIAPKDALNETQQTNMAGMDIDIIMNYNNNYDGGRRNEVTDLCERGALNNLASIPDVNINLIVPDSTKDPLVNTAQDSQSITHLINETNNSGYGNVHITEYEVPNVDSPEFQLYVTGDTHGSHENGRQVLFPEYIAGRIKGLNGENI